MAFEEFTAQLPVGSSRQRGTMAFTVDVDVDTLEPIDIYANRTDYTELSLGNTSTITPSSMRNSKPFSLVERIAP
jgi:hypothetical protein